MGKKGMKKYFCILCKTVKESVKASGAKLPLEWVQKETVSIPGLLPADVRESKYITCCSSRCFDQWKMNYIIPATITLKHRQLEMVVKLHGKAVDMHIYDGTYKYWGTNSFGHCYVYYNYVQDKSNVHVSSKILRVRYETDMSSFSEYDIKWILEDNVAGADTSRDMHIDHRKPLLALNKLFTVTESKEYLTLKKVSKPPERAYRKSYGKPQPLPTKFTSWEELWGFEAKPQYITHKDHF